MRVSAKQFARVLYDLTDGKSKSEISKSVADFALYLQKNRKLKLANKIIEQFSKIYNKKNSIIEAEVITAEKIEAKTQKSITDYIKKNYKTDKIVLKNEIDKKIKGGIVIKIGDEVMDGSVRGRLGELKKILSN